jgi:hypothetical protein
MWMDCGWIICISLRKTAFLKALQTFSKTLGKVKPNGLFWGSKKHMTKLFAIAFTCVYLTLTVGVVHTTHYCMGRVNSSAFFSFESQKCACELFADRDSEACCDDEHALITIEDDHSASVVVSVSPEFFAICDLTVPALEEVVAVGGTASPFNEAPPGYSVPLFVKHCSLILFDDGRIA